MCKTTEQAVCFGGVNPVQLQAAASVCTCDLWCKRCPARCLAVTATESANVLSDPRAQLPYGGAAMPTVGLRILMSSRRPNHAISSVGLHSWDAKH